MGSGDLLQGYFFFIIINNNKKKLEAGHFQVTFSGNRYKGLAFKINQHDLNPRRLAGVFDELLMRSLIEY